jgi:hypothetical protein
VSPLGEQMLSPGRGFGFGFGLRLRATRPRELGCGVERGAMG